MFTEYEEILQRLTELDIQIGKMGRSVAPIHITLLGGAAVIVHGGKRATEDIDIYGERRLYGLGQLFDEFGIQLVAEGIVHLHPDWSERIKKIPNAEFKHLEVTVLDPLDLAISKIARCTARDIEDLHQIAPQIDLDKLVELYRDAMTYWIGPQERFEGALRYALKKVFNKELP